MGFSGRSDDKESAGNAGSNLGLIPQLERSSGRGNGNPSRILAWRILWTEEPGGLQSTGSQRVGHDWATNTFSLPFSFSLFFCLSWTFPVSFLLFSDPFPLYLLSLETCPMWPFISNPTSFEFSHLNQKGFASNCSIMMHFLCMYLKSLIRSQNPTITVIPPPEALTTVFCMHLLHWQLRASPKTAFLGIASLPCILRTSILVSSEKAMASHSSTLAWKIPCMEDLWAVVHVVTKSRAWLSNFTFTFHFHALEKEMATHSNVLAWRIPGTEKPGGLLSMGSHRVGHDLGDLQQQQQQQQQ